LCWVCCRKVDAKGAGILDAVSVLSRYLSGKALEIVLAHSVEVSELSIAVCRHLRLSEPETHFVQQAAMLHDIGVCRVKSPGLGLLEGHPYIMHGILGRDILEQEGLLQHALVCERHIGVGLTVEDIISQSLPLPLRDMSPLTVAEEIVCFADLFYSKKPGSLAKRKSISRVRESLLHFGKEKVLIFDLWLQRFGAAI
jgi:uncharacterized protein